MIMKNIFDSIRKIFSVWVILGGLVFALIMVGVFITLLWGLRPAPSPQKAATAILNVIPLPTNTPLAPPTAVPTLAATLPPTPMPGTISKGVYVQITGTGTDGLRIRDNPGLNGKVKFVGIEAEVFQVLDGPRDIDGYTWWLLVAPYDETVQGWAVANYLAVIQNP